MAKTAIFETKRLNIVKITKVIPIPSAPPQSAVSQENSIFFIPLRAQELPEHACAHKY